MRTQTIVFSERQTRAVFPNERSNLAEALSELGLKDYYPAIVLIGDEIDGQPAVVTQRALEAVARTAADMQAVLICRGTDMGIMAQIGQVSWRHGYKFPLIGVTPDELVTWPGGPHNPKFLWLGKQRWQLESHHSHFILVPGSQFGDESPWISDAATLLSRGHQSVTVLINGGDVSRKDMELSLKSGRPVIVLSRTGGLADELARQPVRDKLITVVPAQAEQRIVEAIQAALSLKEKSAAGV